VICSNPNVGEEKIGDFNGIQVYKFSFNRQEFLIAYRLLNSSMGEKGIDIILIDFYQVGLHENFYNSLKRYLRKE